MKERLSTDARRSIGEAGILLGAVVIDQWVLRDFPNPLFELPALAVVTAVFVMSIMRRGGLNRVLPHPLGSARRAWLVTLLTTALFALVLVLWGFMIRQPYDEIPLKITQAGLTGLLALAVQHLVWAILQQGLLQLFLRPVIGEIFTKSTVATSAAAAIFGLLHLPSLVLTISTMILGAIWIALYSRYRRFWPIVVSHAMLSAVALVALPPQLNYELNVGVIALKRQPEYKVLSLQETQRTLKKVTTDAYFRSAGNTDRDFIESLYHDMLGRTPAETEVRHWLDRMEQNFSRNRIAVGFARSREFRTTISIKPGTEKGPS